MSGGKDEKESRSYCTGLVRGTGSDQANMMYLIALYPKTTIAKKFSWILWQLKKQKHPPGSGGRGDLRKRPAALRDWDENSARSACGMGKNRCII